MKNNSAIILRFTRYIICAAMLFCLATESAMAHKLVVFAWVEGDTVFTESKFASGKKAQNSEVKVFNIEKKVVNTGTTNVEGEYSFTVDKAENLTIEVYAGEGHKGSWKVSADEFSGYEKVEAREPAMMQKAVNQSATYTRQQQTAPAPMDDKQLEEIVERVVEKKIAPIRNMLKKNMDDSPRFRDIMGGIGYILGLMGVAAYFSSRARTKSQ
jgi:nickel transport protein